MLAACSGPVDTPQNVLLISIDTFRADRLGKLDAQGRSLTPNLDAFAQDALVFDSAWSHANETLYSHASLFTGDLASAQGDLDYATYGLRPDADTLAAVLSRAGYRTEAVVAGGHLAPDFGLTPGFQVYASGQDFGSFQQTVPLAVERLGQMALDDKPWLLFVHGYDTHAPYVKWGPLFSPDTPEYDGVLRDRATIPWTCEQIRGDRFYPDFNPEQVTTGNRTVLDPGQFDALDAWADEHEGVALTDDDVAFVRGLYDASVRYADFQVGRMLAELDASGMREETLVVLVSDHGEDLLEHGSVNHRRSLHDENLHVALMLSGPGVEPGVVDTPVGLIDVFPTVNELLGLRERDLPGVSLLSPDPNRAIVSEAVLGSVSVRTSDGRLSLPRQDVGERYAPLTAPARAFITDAEGADEKWASELREPLYARLVEEL
ncbi:MAG: sulfatase [Proteobacteria bacterium]|nr:sulfatase [Pseudomonadota bacterium]MCP4916268.1 sulfatase [Pseudomonadota bacterium]